MAINFVQICRHVGKIRKHRGLSQQKLAELINKSPTYVSYIEIGLKCMSLDTFVSRLMHSRPRQMSCPKTALRIPSRCQIMSLRR